MPVDADTDQRLKELIAKLAVEQNPHNSRLWSRKLNRLLDRGPIDSGAAYSRR
jgi:hypothetical protein